MQGERECVCGDTCLCTVMAKVRHGADTDMAFVGVEFLLPDERACSHKEHHRQQSQDDVYPAVSG